MAVKLVRQVEYGTGVPIGWAHWCPACKSIHVYAVDKPFSNGCKWTFDGNMEKPSFKPSMNISWGKFADPKDEHPGERCHYYVTDGSIIYQGDCTHAMKGQTVPLPDMPPHLTA